MQRRSGGPTLSSCRRSHEPADPLSEPAAALPGMAPPTWPRLGIQNLFTSPVTRASTSWTGRFVVTVEQWSGGWDLHIGGTGLGGGGVTQVTDLDDRPRRRSKYLGSPCSRLTSVMP